ncbi:capsule polysaccharide export protein KpsC/LpsZ [Pseudomonas hunanensis]|uniref:Capsule polysaccharide export protein KpsC/LpsZ n=1 Tax=Pseudomonas hunanensis TaxID=1247546 RepID=A0ACC6K8C1_9PSED|nr:hypothetical protein [Pseudomonas hunanensis]MDR6714698.1 capsule polysaccharide export protein KpsC/LpsZ [Pseudomonas hunanensis]
MGSLNSIFSAPGAFLKGLTGKNSSTTATYVIGFSTWKQYLRKYFPDRNLYFIDKNISKHEFEALWKKKITSQPSAEIFVWGFKAPDFIFNFAQKNGKKLVHIEDGFIRSIGLGAQKTPPMSLTMDTRTPYFDASKPSDLEILLNGYDFDADTELMSRAKSALEQVLKHEVSKYNNSPRLDIQALYGPKTKKRILVIGQVEDDASILLGCTVKMTNNDLVKLALKENPEAQIIYKPHPDVLSGNRPAQSDPQDVNSLCTVITKNLSLPQSFHEVDHVYTLTSLGGFEAVLRGIKVTTIGCPFYSGWGLTDDRQPNPRRTRKLSATELFAAAYILYPKYFNPEEGSASEIEAVVSTISAAMQLIPAEKHTSAVPKVAVKKAPSPTKTTKAPAKKAPVAKAIVAPAKKSAAVGAAKPVLKPAPKPAPNPAPKPAPKPAVAAVGVPEWFNAIPGEELKSALASDKPLYLYIPWIAGHGDALIEKIRYSENYNFAPLDFVKNIDDSSVRQSVLRFTRTDPALYRRMLINRLVPLRGKIKAVVFTFDWSATMRLIADVCEKLDIPRILVPHESVFVDREKYYWDITAKASVPSADLTLGWGGMQKEIFTERGYPAELFRSVGAPKFDVHANYSPSLSRKQFCNLYGLDASKEIILFASQPLDSQLDKKTAQLAQRSAIVDLAKAAELKGMQLLVRLPPNKEEILGAATRKVLGEADHIAIDEGHCYLVSPEEALYHANVVTSINSTMLFEGLLMGKYALSIKYVEFDQIWEKAGIPAAKNLADIENYLTQFSEKTFIMPEEGMKWASEMFGIGEFDGKAAHRIIKELEGIAQGEQLLPRPNAMERLLSRAPLDVVAIPSQAATLDTTQLYLKRMLKARTLISTNNKETTIQNLASVDVFFQWGITESSTKRKQRDVAKQLNRPVVYVEDGFIRSLDIGLAQEPGLSIILDDTTAYYDATKVSRLSRLLENGPELTAEQMERSRSAIDLIVKERISKYNHAPDMPMTIGTPGRKKILLVDQRYGDQSVASGLGSEEAFNQMIQDVCRNRSDCDILIKQHPDAIKGGKSSYFSNEKLAFTQYMGNVFPILFDISPFALFDIVDEVYVMTSGMGFEAMMAGKVVHCYGMPFYAGWGATIDKQALPSRTRQRTVEELFHFAYIESSIYFSPRENRTVEVEDVVKYIAEMKKQR